MVAKPQRTECGNLNGKPPNLLKVNWKIMLPVKELGA